MGVCLSAPSRDASGASPPSEKLDVKTSTQTTGDRSLPVTDVAPTGPVSSGPVVVPVRVFRDDMEIGVKLGTDAEGRLRFTVTDTVEEAREAARALQAGFQGSDINTMENLKLLLSMGIEVRYCSSNPFIGKLTFRFLLVSGTKHAHSTYIKVRCEGDRTMPLYTDAEGDSTSASFRSKDLVLIIIHSDAVAVIKVRDKKDGTAFYGQAKLAVKNIELGTNVREIDIFDPKDATRKVATLKAEVSYEYMRGTTDEGNYLTPSRVIINKRKMGSLAGLAAASNLVKHISQQNHWLLSHDNVWPPSSTYFGTSSSKLSLAVQSPAPLSPPATAE